MAGAGPLTLRLTDINGPTIQDSGIKSRHRRRPPGPASSRSVAEPTCSLLKVGRVIVRR